jgi:hypothetical protein
VLLDNGSFFDGVVVNLFLFKPEMMSATLLNAAEAINS